MSDLVFNAPNEIKDFFNRLKVEYEDSILNDAVSIFIPFPDKRNADELKLSKEAQIFLERYEPKSKESGLFEHQFELLDNYLNGSENFILTSSTGTGKSLCFWTWIIDSLVKNPEATALVCFPTQALMWGQADRLARISSNVKRYDDDCKNLSGTIDIGNIDIDWTIWKGVGSGKTRDTCMNKHQNSPDFKKACIRVATLDKAHWSLIKDSNFTKNLECLVLDEAHIYDGIFGANVHYFLNRVYVAKEMANKNLPNLFLASATLSNAKEFASKLTSIPIEEIYHQSDSKKPEIKSINLDNLENLLINPPQNGLFRINLFLDGLEKDVDLSKTLSKDSLLGKYLNLLYFSYSKFESRLIKLSLKDSNDRNAVIYDGDLTPTDRRKIEALFNDNETVGYSLIATNALELGVDIENLELCLINNIPPRRVDLIQRIGRVGRRSGIPGLVVLKLSAAPLDRFIAENTDDAFNFDDAKTIPLPLDLEMIKLRHITAAHYEGCYRNYCQHKGKEEYNRYSQLIKNHFGIFLDHKKVKQEIEEKYSGLIDTSDKFWVYKGFRAAASEGKIPLTDINSKKDVAWIEDINIFRDAHPEAVYLDANGKQWRVIDYSGDWKVAKWENPQSKFILGKFLKSINQVLLRPENQPLVTRGQWVEKFEPYQIYSELQDNIHSPSNGELEYGVWEYNKKFAGYKEINLVTNDVREVGLKTISNNFKTAIDEKKNFPFLFPLSYRTYGWNWNFKEQFDEIEEELLPSQNLISGIINAYVADTVQSNPSDIICGVSLENADLWVLDSTPGGNGLSEAVLKNDNLTQALERCIETLETYNRPNMKKKFQRYISELCQEEVAYEVQQIIRIIQQIKDLWSR